MLLVVIGVNYEQHAIVSVSEHGYLTWVDAGLAS